MQIVIDISEHIYEHAKETTEDSRDEFEAMRAIANGTPLPKHHGRLIDADRLDKERIDYIVDGYADSPNDWAEFGAMIIKAPTIIPAEEVGE